MSLTLPKCLRPFRDKIADVSDERSSDEGYWVYLANGWRDHEGETHMIHEDTPEECAAWMPYIVACHGKCCSSA